MSSSRYAGGRTALECITGITPEITEYLDFPFGSYITYKSNAGVGDAKLGQWLGVSHRIGPEMAYWILPESCRSISCTIVQRLTNLEMKKDIWRGHINQFESKKKRILEAQSSCIQPDPQIIQS